MMRCRMGLCCVVLSFLSCVFSSLPHSIAVYDKNLLTFGHFVFQNIIIIPELNPKTMDKMIENNENNENDDDNQFNANTDQFIEQLDQWEYNKDGNRRVVNVGRISLYRQFDPLVDTPMKVAAAAATATPPSSNDTYNSCLDPQVDNNNDESDLNSNNRSEDLLHLNTPMKTNDNNDNLDGKNIVVNDNKIINENGLTPLQQQNIEMNDEKIEKLQQKNDDLGLLMEQLLLYNEEIINQTTMKLSINQKDIDMKDEELKKNSMIISQLEEDINGVEKNYYEIHSRYDSLRTLVKEMDQQLLQKTNRIKELKDKLKEKHDDCIRLRQQADEAIET